MAFWIAESTASGTIDSGTIVRLNPGPTYPDYGERIIYTLQETAGRSIRQRSKKNPKEFRWVWVGYGPAVPRYEQQYWQVLFANQAHIRLAAGKSPYVFLKDETTGNFGKYNLASGTIQPEWIRCVVTYVGRTETKAGGNVRYDETEFRFIIDDDSITEIM